MSTEYGWTENIIIW